MKQRTWLLLSTALEMKPLMAGWCSTTLEWLKMYESPSPYYPTISKILPTLPKMTIFFEVPAMKEEHATSFMIILLMIVMMVICATIYKFYVLPNRRNRVTNTDTESKFRLMESKCNDFSNVHVFFLPDEREHQHEDQFWANVQPD